MVQRLLHTPEGVRDIYNSECEEKQVLQGRLQGVLKQYGFSPIETPTFEFFDIFGKEIGTIPSKDLYKFFDREGHTLALRPDITPSVARCVAKYYSEADLPLRLWYQGNTFVNSNSYQGRLKEITQLGGEIIGEDTVDCDGETLALVVQLLKGAGLAEFQISVGHAGFFRELVKAADLQEETVDELRALISNKNFFGVEELLDSLSLNKDLRQLFGAMGVLHDSPATLDALLEATAAYPEIRETLNRLSSLHQVLLLYGIADYISFDLGVISPYAYYTGIVFAGYTYGSGEPVVRGGRYDKLLSYFGKEAPSIGFAIEIGRLMATLSRQGIEISVERKRILIVYIEEKRTQAIPTAEAFRSQGKDVFLIACTGAKTKEEHKAYSLKNGFQEIVFIK